MDQNIREIILTTLTTLEKENQFSNKLIKAVLDKYDYLDSRDKAFVKRVCEGTVERRIEIDYYLNSFSSVPVRKMKPLIRSLLRMSVYQLLYMDTVPDSAVCNEACKLAVAHKFQNLRGFVNGVLRNIARQKDNLPLPDEKKNPVEYFSVKYSMPVFLVEQWQKQYGTELTKIMLEGLLTVHPVSVRFRPDMAAEKREALCEQMREKGADISPNPYLPYAYILKYSDNLSNLPGFSEGDWTIQDVSCALAVEAAGIHKDDLVLDACAAPGGKTLLAASMAAHVYSRDVSPEKTALILENASRMGVDNITVEEWDATVPDESKTGRMDVCLLDVPCSGLGIIGKKRDIKYRVTEEGMNSLCALQKEIVRTCASYVKEGGILLYSTCTVRPEENEEMVRFISEELGMTPVSISDCLPKQVLEEREKSRSLLKGTAGEFISEMTEEQRECFVQMYPGVMACDGFFIAKFKR